MRRCVVSELPWNERVVMLSINPDAASLQDVAKLSAGLMKATELLVKASIILGAHYQTAMAKEIRAFLGEEKKP